MALKPKHLDLAPAAPDQERLDLYHLKLRIARQGLGLQYQSGPRHGQQLAAARARLAGG